MGTGGKSATRQRCWHMHRTPHGMAWTPLARLADESNRAQRLVSVTLLSPYKTYSTLCRLSFRAPSRRGISTSEAKPFGDIETRVSNATLAQDNLPERRGRRSAREGIGQGGAGSTVQARLICIRPQVDVRFLCGIQARARRAYGMGWCLIFYLPMNEAANGSARYHNSRPPICSTCQRG
jgi:hypothetical protein